MEDLVIGTGVPIAYWLTVIGFGVMALSFVIGMIMNIKKSWTFMAGIIVLVVVFFALYSAANGALPSYMPDSQIAKQEITDGVMKFVGAGTLLAVGLTIGAFFFMFLDMIVSIFR